MAIVAEHTAVLQSPQVPALPLVVRVNEPSSVRGLEEVAEPSVVPLVSEVITTVQLPDSFPTRRSSDLDPTKLPGPLVILAVAVPLPSVVPTAVTVMVSV